MDIEADSDRASSAFAGKFKMKKGFKLRTNKFKEPVQDNKKKLSSKVCSVIIIVKNLGISKISVQIRHNLMRSQWDFFVDNSMRMIGT